MSLSRWMENRFVVFALASSSFACLLGHFYGWWTMRAFGFCVLPPCFLLLAFIAMRSNSAAAFNARRWIVEGALGGLVAAIAYDLFRLPFVLHGYPLFGVFPRFGQMLLYGKLNNDFGPMVQIAGWSYHFLNAISLGIMFLALVPRPAPRVLFWGACAWAVCVEIFLLLTPYYSFFKLKLDFPTFIALTLSAHLVFGIVLGWWCSRRIPTSEVVAAR